MSHVEKYLLEAKEIISSIDTSAIENMAEALVDIRNKKGRLFILGVGGSAANASHAVNDFRKLCRIEAYAPTDNVSELTARTNDEGWETTFAAWLEVSNICDKDALLIFSVGGGNSDKKISMNICLAIKKAKDIGSMILGIVGRDDGDTYKHGDHVVVVPTVNQAMITPHAEAFQAVIWHCLVSHPKLQVNTTKW